MFEGILEFAKKLTSVQPIEDLEIWKVKLPDCGPVTPCDLIMRFAVGFKKEDCKKCRLYKECRIKK